MQASGSLTPKISIRVKLPRSHPRCGSGALEGRCRLVSFSQQEAWVTKCATGFVPPYALQEILSALSTDTPESKRTAYFWAFMTFLAHLSFAQVDLFKAWHTRRWIKLTTTRTWASMPSGSVRSLSKSKTQLVATLATCRRICMAPTRTSARRRICSHCLQR